MGARVPKRTRTSRIGCCRWRIYRADRIVDAFTASGPDRLSYRLNRDDAIAIAPGDDRAADQWTELDPRAALLIVPPGHAPDRRRYQHRVRRPIVARVGPYRVRATVDVIAGIKLDPYSCKPGASSWPRLAPS